MMEKKVINYVKRAGIAIFAILIYFNSSSMQNSVLHFLNIDVASMSTVFKILFLIGWDIILMVIFAFLYYRSFQKDIKLMKEKHKEYYQKYLKYWLLSVGIMFVSNAIIMMITGNSTSGNEKAIRELFSTSPLYVYFSGVIFAPFVEELIFRKCFHDLIPNRYLFIFISGFVFGGLHVLTNYSGALDLLYLIPYCAPGLVFAYIMEKTDNVLVSIGLHFLHNGILISIQMFFYLFMNQ